MTADHPSVSIERYVDSQVGGIHNHIDRQLTVQQQQMKDGLAVMAAKVDGFYATRDQIMVSLRENLDQRAATAQERSEINRVRIEALAEHVEQIFHEKDRATEMATSEREKAANALRTTLERAITEADNHLREHVALQVDQIHVALQSSELLERERVALLVGQVSHLAASFTERMAGMRRELEAAGEAAKEAVTKAENATEKRLEGLNEFRQQLSDQNSSFLPRETFQATVDGWGEWRTTIEARLSQTQGESSGKTEQRTSIYATIATIVAVLAVIVAVVGLVLR
jgi:hypothetical protein